MRYQTNFVYDSISEMALQLRTHTFDIQPDETRVLHTLWYQQFERNGNLFSSLEPADHNRILNAIEREIDPR